MEPPVLRRWILIWFAISSALILWDCTFVLARPDSFFWAPYAKYITVDHGYRDPDGFVYAQAIMSLVELVIVAVAVALRRRAVGVLLACVVSALTAAKTILILLIELVTRGQHVGHNPLGDLILLYILPNTVWIVVPIVVAFATGRALLPQR